MIRPQFRRLFQAISNIILFSNNKASTLVPNVGTGVISFARASTVTFIDFEGLQKTAPAGCTLLEGFRSVQNLISSSASLASGSNITLTLAAGDYTFSMGAGSGTATFSGTGGATGTLAANATNRTMVTKTITAGTLVITASVATLVDLQLELVTGQTIKTASEYVSNGVLSSPWHGAGVDGFKWFDTTNGNTVNATVLTEAVGVLITNGQRGSASGGYGRLYEQASTNYFLNAQVNNQCAIATGTQNAPSGNSCRKVTVSSGAVSYPSFGQYSSGVSISLTNGQSQYIVLSGYVGNLFGTDNLEPHFIVNVNTNNASNSVYCELQINLTDFTVRSKSVDASFTEIIAPTLTLTPSGMYFLQWIVKYNQGATIRNTVKWYCQIRNQAGSGTYTANGSSGFNYDSIQGEISNFATSYIPTTTAAASRSATVESFTASSINTLSGGLYLEFRPTHAPVDTIYLWGSYVDSSNYTAILHNATNLIFRKCIAGTNYDTTIANAFTAYTLYKVAVSWGTFGTLIALNGALGTGQGNSTALQLGSTFQIGADGNGTGQPEAYITKPTIYKNSLTQANMAAMTL